MRLFVFVLSIALVVSTTYAHAIVWLPAVSGAVIRTAAGHYMKVASKKALAGSLFVAGGYGTNFAVNYCKKNQKKCKDILGDAADYFFDDDNNNNKEDPVCPGKVVYTIANSINGKRPSLSASSYKDYCENFSHREVFGFAYSYFGSNHQVNEIGEERQSNAAAVKTCEWSYIDIDGKKRIKTEPVYKSCIYNPNNTHEYEEEIRKQRQKKQEELTKKIVQNLSDDDITYIINNYGDQINIDKYCAAPGACAELEQSFGDEVMNNKNKYDIDKINKDNCEVRDGKITSCDKAKKDTDDDDSDTPKDTDTKPKDGDDGDDGDDGKDGDDDNDNSSNDKDDKPINCDSSLFHKKVCDFIDWYQSDDYEKTDNKINIQDDTPKPTNTNIEFSGSCPASYVVSHTLHFGMLGSYDFEFTLLDTPKLCNFLNDWIKPIMMFLGPLHATYIIGKRDE